MKNYYAERDKKPIQSTIQKTQQNSKKQSKKNNPKNHPDPVLPELSEVIVESEVG